MNATEGNSSASLTLQARNLLLAEPIARLSLDRGVIFQGDPEITDHLDVQYLALSAIDYVMERSAIESGGAPREIVEHIASEARRMKPGLTDERSRKVGQVVLDCLANAREGHKAFRAEYYDDSRGGFSFHDFRLLDLFVAVDGTVRFKLARGAQVLTLAMLDVSPEFAQEAEAIMIRKAVERGRFRDARTMAQRARLRSIHYQQFIEDRLFRVRRAAYRLAWSADVLPELDNARAHLDERRKHELAIVESIQEHIAQASGDTRDQLVDLKDTIDECHQRHAALLARVMSASEEFREYQAGAFRVRPAQDVPDLEDRILSALLAAPLGSVAAMCNELGIVFAAPRPPRLLDLALLFDGITESRERRDPAVAADAQDLVAIERVLPQFDVEEIQAAESWLIREIAARASLDMESAIRAAEQQELADSTLRCVLFLMLRSWCPSDDPLGVIATIDGALSHARAAGDNLVLTRDEERWTA